MYIYDKLTARIDGIWFWFLKKTKDGSIKIDRKPDDKAYTPPEKYEDAIEIWTKNTKKDYKRFK